MVFLFFLFFLRKLTLHVRTSYMPRMLEITLRSKRDEMRALVLIDVVTSGEAAHAQSTIRTGAIA
jgi:hypothetical protein